MEGGMKGGREEGREMRRGKKEGWLVPSGIFRSVASDFYII